MPYQLTEGSSYTLSVRVKNKSTRSGVLIDANLAVVIQADIAGAPLFNEKTERRVIPAGGTVTVSVSFTVPLGKSGQVGSIHARVLDPENNEIRSASETLQIGRASSEVKGKVYDMVTSAGIAGVAITIGGVVSSSGPDGSYSVPIYAGSYRATYLKDGYEPTIYEVMTVTPGENVRNVGLVPSPQPTAKLSGKVTDSVGGAPVSGVKVTLTGYRATPQGYTVQVYYEALTDTGGIYSFTGVLTMSYALSFIKDGYEPKAVSVTLKAVDNEMSAAIKPVAPGSLTIYLGASLTGATVWDAKVYDFASGRMILSTPSGIKEPHIPAVFPPIGNTFLLYVQEQKWGGPAPWFGPYLMTVPSMGSYIWNAQAATLGGIAAVNLPMTANRARITGTFDGWSVYIEKAEDVAGLLNAAKLFVGRSVSPVATDIPFDEERGYYITGPITGELTIRRNPTNTDYEWFLTNVKAVLPYPPEDYVFTGSLAVASYDTPYPGQKSNVKIAYSVARAKPGEFAVLISLVNQWGYSVGWPRFVGPASGQILGPDVNPYATGSNTVVMYANPDLGASFETDPYGRWLTVYNEARGWVKVATLSYR